MPAKHSFFLAIVLSFCALSWLVQAQARATEKPADQTGWAVFQLSIPQNLLQPFVEGNKVAWRVANDGAYLGTLFELHSCLPIVFHSG